jgi:hypothetical protein
MTEELRTRLQSELDAERRPPLGDVVSVALRDGKRIRRVRRFGAVGAGTAVAGVVALAVAFVGPFGSPGGSAAPAPRVEAAAAPVLAYSAGGDLAAATPATLLELLTTLVPTGTTSDYARGTSGLGAQLYLDLGKGPGMIRVVVSKDKRGHGVRKGQPKVRVDHPKRNCVQKTVVEATWNDGTKVLVSIASCLAWDGTQNKPAAAALTAAQATVIATDPRWGVEMDAALVAAGAKQFPQLPDMTS